MDHPGEPKKDECQKKVLDKLFGIWYLSYMPKIQRLIREIAVREKISIYRLAKDLGLDYSTVYKSVHTGNPTAKTIERILDLLGYEIRIVKSSERRNLKSRTIESNK